MDNVGTALFVTSSSNPSIAGSALTFTVTLGGSPTGTVIFLDGGTSLGIGVFTTGTATFSTSSLNGGDHTITAVYTDAANSMVSASNTLTQRVQQTTVTTTLSSLNPGIAGQSITFTATVVGAIDVVTGTVTFQEGSTSLAVSPLNDLGMATFSSTSLTSGSHTITAIYSGDSNNAPTTSAPLTVTVYQTGPVLTLTTAQNPSAPGSAVTFTATVTATPSPTGTVTFLDGGASIGTGTFNGTGVATYSTSSLSGGDHDITAIYTDGTSVIASVSNTLTERVQQTTSAWRNTASSSGWGDSWLGAEDAWDGEIQPVGFLGGDDGGGGGGDGGGTATPAPQEAQLRKLQEQITDYRKLLGAAHYRLDRGDNPKELFKYTNLIYQLVDELDFPENRPSSNPASGYFDRLKRNNLLQHYDQPDVQKALDWAKQNGYKPSGWYFAVIYYLNAYIRPQHDFVLGTPPPSEKGNEDPDLKAAWQSFLVWKANEEIAHRLKQPTLNEAAALLQEIQDRILIRNIDDLTHRVVDVQVRFMEGDDPKELLKQVDLLNHILQRADLPGNLQYPYGVNQPLAGLMNEFQGINAPRLAEALTWAKEAGYKSSEWATAVTYYLNKLGPWYDGFSRLRADEILRACLKSRFW